MSTNRIAAFLLSLLLASLLSWMLWAGLGDLVTRLTLAAGATLGLLYSAFGELPEWMVDRSGGTITDDDDPSNISPRVYLPVLAVVILVAIGAFVWVVWR